jgi:hypothetical protein
MLEAPSFGSLQDRNRFTSYALNVSFRAARRSAPPTYSRRTAGDAIFSELCMSERTLQRRETFAAVDDARHVMCEDD